MVGAAYMSWSQEMGERDFTPSHADMFNMFKAAKASARGQKQKQQNSISA